MSMGHSQWLHVISSKLKVTRGVMNENHFQGSRGKEEACLIYPACAYLQNHHGKQNTELHGHQGSSSTLMPFMF